MLVDETNGGCGLDCTGGDGLRTSSGLPPLIRAPSLLGGTYTTSDVGEQRREGGGERGGEGGGEGGGGGEGEREGGREGRETNTSQTVKGTHDIIHHNAFHFLLSKSLHNTLSTINL